MSQDEQFLKQVEKLTASELLHGSESLCKLLRYLAKQALEHPGVGVKEYQIATEVFGRPADFDPQSDSGVRVQAGRLRAKLAEYYADKGADDPIVIDLPKGSYALNFRYRAPESNVSRHVDPSIAGPTIHTPRTFRPATIALIVACLVTIAALIVAVESVRARDAVPGTNRNQHAGDIALEKLWKPLLIGPNEPWVIFSNAEFVGRPETGIRYFNPATDSGRQIWDHYTGVGEVLAVHSLDQVFASMHHTLRVKRGSLLSLDDARDNDLIFLGSPSENLTLLDIPNTQEFVFKRVASGPRKGDLAIANVHPQAGEPAQSLASPSGSPLAEDYAIVAFLPGLNPGRSVIIIAGTTTFGTEGAAEFLTKEASVKMLLQKLGATGRTIGPFEALLHVKISKGVPLEAELVAVRKR